MSDAANDRQIAALLRERAALRQVDDDERVKLIDDELKVRGHKDEDEKAARKQAPQGRQQRPQQTGD